MINIRSLSNFITTYFMNTAFVIRYTGTQCSGSAIQTLRTRLLLTVCISSWQKIISKLETNLYLDEIETNLNASLYHA
jgi:hypothetical protein